MLLGSTPTHPPTPLTVLLTEIQNLQVAWKEKRNAYVLWNFVPSLIAFFCCFAASYINLDAEKFWSWLEKHSVVIAALAVVGFVCNYCHNYLGKVKKG